MFKTSQKVWWLLVTGIVTFSSMARAEPEKDITIAFSPKREAEETILKAIQEAKKTIRVAAYSFTSKPISQALMNAHKQGIDVQVVLDKSNVSAKYSAATFLANIGIETRIDYKYPIMHNKFMVIDNKTVQTGSFNYSNAAQDKNAENVIVLRDMPEIAAKYSQEWSRLWQESVPYKAKY